MDKQEARQLIHMKEVRLIFIDFRKDTEVRKTVEAEIERLKQFIKSEDN